MSGSFWCDKDDGIADLLWRKAEMKQAVLTLAVVAVYVLHQDIWFWGTPHPLVFGFLPIGLFYHAGFTVGAAGLMWAFTAHRCIQEVYSLAIRFAPSSASGLPTC